MQEMQVQSLGLEDPLEKEMTTHSSILAWEISWTEDPGELQSTGSKKRYSMALNNNFLRLPGKISFPIKEIEIRGNVSLFLSFLPSSP